jgi:riboflavin kinase/FMN adenylyltransferase
MDIFRGTWSNFTDVKDSVVTVGTFDGVHAGHRAIIQRVVESANLQGLRSVLITFDTHPRHVVHDGNAPVPLLTTIEEKLALLAPTGLHLAMILHFDHSLAHLSPLDFVQIILKGRVGMRRIVIGYNHAFGKNRTGDRETLIAMSRALGFSVEVVNPIRVNDQIINSTHIRNLISQGSVGEAAIGLGRYYSVRGVIIHGFGRGKRMNCPTANLGLIKPEKLSPHDGIYAGIARLGREVFPAAISIGYNPTFGEGKHSLEAHILGFDRDIYGEELEIQFVERLRSEKKYSNEAELAVQIKRDVEHVAQIIDQHDAMRKVQSDQTQNQSQSK